MFETAADQADGLRRLFSPREPSVIPMACCAAPVACRGYAGMLAGRLRRSGMTPVLFDRLDLGHDLGDVQAHAPFDRVVLLEEPVRLARWLEGRKQAMLLLLSHERDVFLRTMTGHEPAHAAAHTAVEGRLRELAPPEPPGTEAPPEG